MPAAPGELLGDMATADGGGGRRPSSKMEQLAGRAGSRPGGATRWSRAGRVVSVRVTLAE